MVVAPLSASFIVILSWIGRKNNTDAPPRFDLSLALVVKVAP